MNCKLAIFELCHYCIQWAKWGLENVRGGGGGIQLLFYKLKHFRSSHQDFKKNESRNLPRRSGQYQQSSALWDQLLSGGCACAWTYFDTSEND